jgi:hypothetical protein
MFVRYKLMCAMAFPNLGIKGQRWVCFCIQLSALRSLPSAYPLLPTSQMLQSSGIILLLASNFPPPNHKNTKTPKIHQ